MAARLTTRRTSAGMLAIASSRMVSRGAALAQRVPRASRAPARPGLATASVTTAATTAAASAVAPEDFRSSTGVASILVHYGDAEAQLRRAYSDVGVSVAAGACVVPHPEKMGKGGEDAFFISLYSHKGDSAKVNEPGHVTALAVVGVADGVGGWATQGVDPRAFSVGVMRAALMTYEKSRVSDATKVDPHLLLESANQIEVLKKTLGSCTACVAVLYRKAVADGEDKFWVRLSNLGDSGLRVLRHNTIEDTWSIVFETTEQQHYFNCPFQIPTDPVSAADDLEVEVEAGDIVLLGTDGLFDNLFSYEIEENIAATYHGNKNATENEVARALTTRTREVMNDPMAVSPFAKNSNHMFMGGKLDDIAVIVMRVGETSGPRAAL
jgi:protein phosphatase PTC7